MMIESRFGRVYVDNSQLKIVHGIGKIYLQNDDGHIHRSMIKKTIQEIMKNTWVKKLKGDKYLIIYDGNGYITNGYKLKEAKWMDVYRNFETDTYEDKSSDLPEL